MNTLKITNLHCIRKVTLIVVLVFRTGFDLIADSHEYIHLRMDKRLYFAGDNLQFALWCYGEEGKLHPEPSSIAYIELVSPENTPVLTQKVYLNQGFANSLITLPKELPSGNFTIRAYTRWMRNFEESYFFKAIVPVINPLTDKVSGSVAYHSDVPDFTNNSLPEKELLTIEVEDFPENKSVESGETFLIRLSVKDNKGQLVPNSRVCARVHNQVALNNFAPTFGQRGFYDHKMDKQIPKIRFLQEKDPFVNLCGTLIDQKSNLPLSGKTILMVSPGEHSILFSAKTDTSGHFCFELNNQLSGKKQLVFLPVDVNTPAIVTLDDEFAFSAAAPISQSFLIDSMLLIYVRSHLVDYQLEHEYRTNPNGNGYTLSHDFFGKPDETILVDKFIRLPNMSEVFVELVKSVMVVNTSKGPEIKVLDRYRNKTIDGKATVLVDGVPIEDHSAIMKINPADLSRISVLASQYMVGHYIMNGVIEIESKKHDLSCVDISSIMNVFDYSFPKQSVPIENETQAIKNVHQPDLRSVLYWNPALNTDAAGNLWFRVSSSEIKGPFVIELEAITNNGETGTLVLPFEVK